MNLKNQYQNLNFKLKNKTNNNNKMMKKKVKMVKINNRINKWNKNYINILFSTLL